MTPSVSERQMPDLVEKIRDAIIFGRLRQSPLTRGDRDAFVKSCVDHIYPALEACKRAHGGWQAAQRVAV